MECPKNCIFGGKTPYVEALPEAVVTGTLFIGAAIGVNALVMSLSEVEDLFPAVINGGCSGMSLLIVHRLRHALTDEKVVNQWSGRDRLKNMLGLIMFSVGSTAAALKYYHYPLKKWQITQMQTLSILGMAGLNKYLLTT